MRRRLVAFVPSLVLLGIACVGAEATSILNVSNDASTTSDGGGSTPSPTASNTNEPTTPGEDAATPEDASIKCDAGLSACSGVCVDTITAATDCGACGHSCGKGTCTEGICRAATFRDVNPGSRIAAGPNDLFFTNGFTVESCPLAGCTVAPTQIVRFNHYELPSSGFVITTSSNLVLFQASPDGIQSQENGVYGCPFSGCTANPPSLSFGVGKFIAIEGMTTQGSDVAWIIANNAIVELRTRACEGDAGTCAANARLLDDNTFRHWQDTSSQAWVALDSTNAYYLERNPDGGTYVELRYCARAGCNSQSGLVASFGKADAMTRPVGMSVSNDKLYVARSDNLDSFVQECKVGEGCKTIAAHVPRIKHFRTDATNFYVADENNNDIYTCKLTGCPTGVTYLERKTNADELRDLAVGGGFVYWVESGGRIRYVATRLP